MWMCADQCNESQPTFVLSHSHTHPPSALHTISYTHHTQLYTQQSQIPTHTPQQLSQPALVGCILDDPQLNVGAELLPKLLVRLLIHLLEHVQGLPHQLLLDHLEQLMLLEHLTRHIQGKIIRVNLRVCVCE